jgi:hypothetical protein
MVEHVWLFYIFGIRIGWQKYFTNWFFYQKNYLSIGKLDFYIE